MQEIIKIEETTETFESIKHLDEYGNEYWYARELMKALEYSKWGNFVGVIDKAKSACKLSNNTIDNHFADVSKTINMPKGATKTIDLTKYQPPIKKTESQYKSYLLEILS